MPTDPITFALMLGAVISGTTEALVGKSVEATPALAKRIQRTASLVEAQPLSAVEVAVAAAVEAARLDLRQDAIDGLLYADDESLADLIALLDHPPFAKELVSLLVVRGRPDFDSLRRAYLDLEGETDSARWQALKPSLESLFEYIEEYLLSDVSGVGKLLRDLRSLAKMNQLEENTAIVATAIVQVVSYQDRIAQATEETAAAVRALLDGQTLALDQFSRLLAEALALLGQAGPAGPAIAPILSAQETVALHELRDKCNKLPLSLAQDERGQAGKHGRPTELARVYVNLETDAEPTLAEVFRRLNIAEQEWPRLTAAMQRRGHGSDGPDALAEEMVTGVDRLMLGDQEQDFADHPLHPWVEDEEALRRAMRKVTALEALANRRRLVLLGKPGSGKSTFVNHLAYAMAGGLLDEEPDWSAMLEGRFDTPLFPIRIILRRLSASLTPNSRPGAALIEEALQAITRLDGAALLARLERADTLLLFDGLDEAPPADPDDDPDDGNGFDRRRIIVESVQAFCAAHPKPAVLVTSRVRPYEQGQSRLDDLPAYTLEELDDERIARFTLRWHEEIERVGQSSSDDVANAREQLTAALASRPTLREMAGTPLLLTMLARVNLRGRLPEGRAELYGECTNQLLWEWEKGKEPESDGTFESLQTLLTIEGEKTLSIVDLERLLWEMTFHAHGRSGREDVELPAADLEKRLAKLHPKRYGGKAWAARVVDLMRERGGLLLASDNDTFTYPHRSFQEYLAARWLLEDSERNELAAQKATSDIWREVVLLACGHLTAEGRYGELQALVAELAGGTFDNDEDRRRLLVAGQAWLEFGPEKATGYVGTELQVKIPRLLTNLMQDRTALATQRLEAGQTAADLGELPNDLDAFVPPLAEIGIGLGDGLAMAKYPVTNEQYRRFWDDAGYETDKPWWDAEAVKELDRWVGTWRNGPRLWNVEQFNRPTFPVVGVSWYEAVAYCAWLTPKLRSKGVIPESHEVRLPTQEEWERAVRGRHGKEYPWGDDTFDASRANTKESELDAPTPVHMYRDGATPEGIWDLSGNVWEWSADIRSDTTAFLRGGAWYTNGQRTGASGSAFRDYLWGWDYNYGFRVVVAPI